MRWRNFRMNPRFHDTLQYSLDGGIRWRDLIPRSPSLDEARRLTALWRREVSDIVAIVLYPAVSPGPSAHPQAEHALAREAKGELGRWQTWVRQEYFRARFIAEHPERAVPDPVRTSVERLAAGYDAHRDVLAFNERVSRPDANQRRHQQPPQGSTRGTQALWRHPPASANSPMVGLNNDEPPSIVVTRVIGPNERADQQEDASIGDEDEPQARDSLQQRQS